MEANRQRIPDIFNSHRHLEIPFFQRSYVWEMAQWERFLEDMERISYSNKPYFLGSVILKQQQTNLSQGVGDIRTVVDGQQRLTTLSIFFKVLSLKINNSRLAEMFLLPFNDNALALLHNHNDIANYTKIMTLTVEDFPKLLNELKAQANISNIVEAFLYFSENIDTNSLNFQNILSNVMFVVIDLGMDDDEQQIFDTINSLGVVLTTAELLKNYFFGRNDIKYYEENWCNIFEKDEETKAFWDIEFYAGRFKRSFIDLFFYSFLQIKIQDKHINISTDDKNDFTKVEGLFDSYKVFIGKYNIDKRMLIAEIREYADVFRKGFDINVTLTALPDNIGIDRINALIFGLENSTLIPYVLYVLKNASAIEQEKIFDYLESYIMRRMVCRANNKNYNQLFSDRFISNQILTAESLREYIDERSDKVNYMPTNNELLSGFHESKLTNKQSAGILYFLESKVRNKSKHSTALLGLNNYSLEHIMPKKWRNHWGKPIIVEDFIKRDRKLLTLGNLTIITASLNSSIRDSAWDVKKTGKGNKAGLIHYASGLDTFSEYLQLDIWDENTITDRASHLYELAKDTWKI